MRRFPGPLPFCTSRRTGDRHTVHNALGDAVGAVGDQAHRHPFAVGAKRPVVHVHNCGVSGRSSGGETAGFDDHGAALADLGNIFGFVPVFVNELGCGLDRRR